MRVVHDFTVGFSQGGVELEEQEDRSTQNRPRIAPESRFQMGWSEQGAILAGF